MATSPESYSPDLTIPKKVSSLSFVPAGTEDYPPRTRDGKLQARRPNWIMFLRAVPGLIQQLQKVPSSAWSIDSLADEHRVAMISCPCGEEPTVPEMHSVECECGRIYVYLGEEMRVCRPEGVPAGLPTST